MRSPVNYHPGGISVARGGSAIEAIAGPSCPFPSLWTRRSCHIPLTGRRSSSRSSLNLDSWYPLRFRSETSISRGWRLTMTFLWGSPKRLPANLHPLRLHSFLNDIFEMTTLQLDRPQDSLVHQLPFSYEMTRRRLQRSLKKTKEELQGLTAVLANINEVSMDAVAVPVDWITLKAEMSSGTVLIFFDISTLDIIYFRVFSYSQHCIISSHCALKGC